MFWGAHACSVLATSSSKSRTFRSNFAAHFAAASQAKFVAAECRDQHTTSVRSPDMSASIIGPARNRVDGRLKVTGAAKYAVEFEVPNCAYGWPIESNISKGKILSMDTSAAEALPGVLKILT